MKHLLVLLLLIFATDFSAVRDAKQPLNESAIKHIETTFASMKELDQRYRSQLAYGTTDPTILARIDSVCNAGSIQQCFAYKRSLDYKLKKSEEDSLWILQTALDFQNHMTARGIWERYGWISKDVVEENNGIQILLLLHPPHQKSEVPAFLEEYSSLLIEEVNSGRMPAKSYAMFYDNMKGKILKEPQLYGTNSRFDVESKKVLPPEILDIEVTNAAREKIGLDPLSDGEYLILEAESK